MENEDKSNYSHFRFTTTHGWSLDLLAPSKKDAINKFIEITGPGVTFQIVTLQVEGQD